MKKYAYLIGNGLNRASANTAWVDMLSEIGKKYKIQPAEQCTNFPLEFERIYLEALKAKKIKNAYELKADIVKYLPSVTDLSLHKDFMDLPINDVMTTNYDYFLEKSILPEFDRKNFGSNTKERKHSLSRRITHAGKSIWHIHGEAHCPDSICLGYDQYCMYLARIAGFLTSPQQGRFKKPYINHFFEQNDADINIWPTRFFTHDLCIFGLTMSFLEIELWWLLSYRRRFMLENRKYKISNNIYFFYTTPVDCNNTEQLSLLKSMGVEPMPVSLENDDWQGVYKKILLEIKSIMSK